MKNQEELGSILEETQFKTLHSSQLKDDEYTFNENDSCSGKNYEESDFSGLMDPNDISVRYTIL